MGAIQARRAAFCLAASIFAANAVAAEVAHPDEPGINPNREYVHQNFAEHIDPYNGNLQLHYVDVFVPGNGGLDLKIQRSYNLLQATANSPFGRGWQIHFGRVRHPANASCANAAGQSMTIELPDGSSQTLHRSSGVGGTSGSDFITTSFWKGQCVFNGMNVFSPDGTRYEMTESDGGSYWHVQKIVDRNGNFMSFTYVINNTFGMKVVSAITTSDGRNANFTYSGDRLYTIVAQGRTWYYTMQTAADGSSSLASVKPPVGNAWSYAYFGNRGSIAGSFALQTVTYPQGGTVTYDYQYTNFLPGIISPRTWTTVKTKQTSDGTWTYTYTPSTASGTYDQTVVALPTGLGSITYKHVGYATVGQGEIWKTGLLMQKTISGPFVSQTETYSFSPQKISSESHLREGYGAWDLEIDRPLLSSKTISRDGGTYTTTYSNPDSFGSPQTITESGTDSRTRTLAYFNDVSQWIVGLPDDETISGVGAQGGVGTISRTRYPNGNLWVESKFGVATTFTYTTQGDLSTRVDARNSQTSFSSYAFGVPSIETRPESVTINRHTDTLGNVDSESDGEATWHYDYDDLSRITGVTYPVGAPATITWTDRTRTLSRGSYSHVTQFDTYGRVTSVTKGGVQQTFQFDALGRKTQETLPGSASAITYTLDALGRPKTVISPAGTKSFSYTANQVVATNERGYSTTYTYERYGDPDAGHLLKIDAGAGTLVTMTRDKIGTLLTVQQGALTRTYGRDTHLFLTSIYDPEIATTTSFGRDEVGNMKSKQVGSDIANFTYDRLNRLKSIQYGGSAGTVDYTYDGRGKVTRLTSPGVDRVYDYDGNGNLKKDEITIDARTFTMLYDYDTIDGLRLVTYPMGKGTVTYTPDAFGRPTVALPYLTNVQHRASGNLSSMTFANGIVTSYDENEWQLPSGFNTSQIQAGATYDYDGVGNVKTITDRYVPSQSRTLGYDAADRLTSASGPWGAGTFDYWGDGNIKFQQLGSYRIDYGYTNGQLRWTTGSRPMTFQYDTQGNVTSNGAITFDYDSASHMTCAKCGTPDEVKYQYDGQGRRVSELKGGYKTYFVQAPNGDLQFEYAVNGKIWTKHAYLHGKRIASETDSDAIATTTSFSVSPPSPIYGSAANFNVTVSPVATGTVEIREGSTVYGSGTLTGSQTSISVSNLPGGSHTIVAAYLGDASNQASVSTLSTVVVGKRGSATTLTSSPSAGSLGQAATLTANVTGVAPTGQVQFSDGGNLIGTANIASGVATLTTAALPAGTHNFGATYAGDGNHLASTANGATTTINQSGSNVSLSSSNPNSYSGQAVTFTATVAASASMWPTGTMSFYDGGAVIGTSAVTGQGTAAFVTNQLSVGTHDIVAVYSGDTNYVTAGSSPLTQVITGRTATTAQVTGPVKPTYSNQSMKLTVSVTGTTPSGLAHIKADGVEVATATIVSGVGSVSIRLAVGTHTLQTVYDGDSSNEPSTSGNVDVVVRPGQQPQDFNLDGKADLLWFRPSDRAAMTWQMDGATIDLNSPSFGAGAVNTEVIGSGDFDGNGKSDLLWFSATDRMASVQLSATGAQQNVMALEAGWKFGQVADFNGDGNDDIFWFHADGRTLVWVMNGAQVTTSTIIASGGSGYLPVIAADFNSDNIADLLWYRSSDGMLKVRLADGTVAEIGAAAAGSELRAVGDLNADGKADLVWYKPADRSASGWLMNGVQTPTTMALGQGAADFELIGAADFNADGKADGIWFRASDAMLAFQFTNGAWTLVDQADPGWVLKGLGQPILAWKSVVTSPAASTVLTSSSMPLTWTAGTLVTERYLSVGTTLGGGEIYSGYQSAAVSRLITGIPINGAPIYVRLSSWIDGAWIAQDVMYSTSGGAPAKSEMISPTAGSVLSSSNVTFTWDAGSGVTEWYLTVGPSSGSAAFYGAYPGGTSAMVTNLPTDGSTVYVTLSSWVSGGWQSSSYTYVAGATSSPRASAITTPTSGSTLGSSTVTFGWDAGSGVTERYLSVGTSLGASDIFGAYEGGNLSAAVSGIPSGGQTIYVRLLSWVNGGWVASDATYTSQ